MPHISLTANDVLTVSSTITEQLQDLPTPLARLKIATIFSGLLPHCRNIETQLTAIADSYKDADSKLIPEDKLGLANAAVQRLLTTAIFEVLCPKLVLEDFPPELATTTMFIKLSPVLLLPDNFF